jgi:hypothetical protein
VHPPLDGGSSFADGEYTDCVRHLTPVSTDGESLQYLVKKNHLLSGVFMVLLISAASCRPHHMRTYSRSPWTSVQPSAGVIGANFVGVFSGLTAFICGFFAGRCTL